MTYKSSSRDGATIRLLAGHTTESAWTVDQLADFFSREDAQGSAHAGIDADTIMAMVPEYRAAWTLRSGNPISLNAELCAFAGMTREQWLRPDFADFSGKATNYQVKRVWGPRGILHNFSEWLADMSARYDIPLVKLTPQQVAAGMSGVIGHIDWTEGMRDGTHTDPETVRGTFPWDIVLADARAMLAERLNPTEEAPEMFSVTVPAHQPPPPEEQKEGVDYSLRVGIPLPPSEYGWECSIQTSGGVANIGHWYWTEQHADGVLITPAMDALSTNKMGIGRFDLQPGFRHTYPGHPNYSGVDIRVFRSAQPVIVVLRERRAGVTL